MKRDRRPRADSPPAAAAPLRVLLARGSAAQELSLVETLEREGFDITEVADGFALLARMVAVPWFQGDSQAYDLVIADERLPGSSGVEVLEEMRGLGSSAAVAVVTEHPATTGLIQHVQELGAQVFDSAEDLVAFARTRRCGVSGTPASSPPDVLSKLLKQLTFETDLPELRTRLCELLPQLSEELSKKVEADGIHEEIRSLDPAASFALHKLAGEHTDLLADVGELIELTDQPAPTPSVSTCRSRLAKRIRDHRQTEDNLLIEAYFRDVGGH